MSNVMPHEELLEFLDTPDFSTTPSPSWLLNDFDDDSWYLQTQFGKEVFDTESGTWHSPHVIHWNLCFANGDHLTDPPYANTLAEVKQLTYLARSGPSCFTDSPITHKGFALSLLLLLRFGELEGLGQVPEMLRFGNFTQAHVDLFVERCVGGIPEILRLPDRLASDLQQLHDTSQLHKVTRADGTPNFEAIASRLGVSLRQISTVSKIEAILAQYGIKKSKDKADAREYRDYRTVPRELSNGWPSQTTIATWLTAWHELFRQSPYIDGGLDFDPFDGVPVTHLARKLGRAKKRTPSIPRNIALHLLDHAIRWVMDYGSALIDYHQALEDEMLHRTADRTARFDYYAPQIYERVTQPAPLQTLHIARYQAYLYGTPWPTRRQEKSMADVMRALIAACAVILGTFTARRGEELLAIRCDDLSGTPGTYRLRIYAEKVTGHAPTQPLYRPIPDIAATAFKLLRRLSETSDKPWLFALPETLGGTWTMSTLHNGFALFSDLIDSPLLYDGETAYRWYLRSHELRRFFAMAFFWHRPDASLDALSWFLGHLNRDDTLRYVQESIGGTEMAEEEAQYTVYSLRTGGANIRGFDQLNQDIVTQFDAESVEIIPDKQLEGFLHQLHESGALSIRLIESPEDSTGSAIAIYYEAPQNGTA